MSVTIQGLSVTDAQYTNTAISALHTATDLNVKRHQALDEYERVNGRGAPTRDGGSLIKMNVLYGSHSDRTEMIGGFEPVNQAVRDIAHFAIYPWYRCIMPVVQSGREEDENAGVDQILDDWKIKNENVISTFMRDMNTHILQGGVAGFSQMNHWNGVDTTTGFLEENVPSAQSNSWGGLARATTRSYPGGANQSQSVAGSWNTAGQTSFDRAFEDAQYNSPGSGPSTIIMSIPAYVNLERSMRPNMRFTPGVPVEGRIPRILWNGVPIGTDGAMPGLTGTGTVTSVSGTEISAYGVDMKHIPIVWRKGRYFSPTKFKEQSGYDVRALFVIVMCQMVADSLGGSFVVVGGDTF